MKTQMCMTKKQQRLVQMKNYLRKLGKKKNMRAILWKGFVKEKMD